MKSIHISCDALIIGGGSAGMWSAKRIKELDPSSRVVIVDKGAVKWGGLMSHSGGDFEAVMPDENVNDWVRDAVYYWDGLCEQDIMEDIYAKTYDRLCDYKSMGCEYLTDDEGNMRGVPQRGLAHCKLYPTKFKGTGGETMARLMMEQMDRLGVEYISRIQITDLIKRDDRVIGAVGFDYVTGDFVSAAARVVILAAGPASWKPGYNGNTSTGEWVELAFRAGAKLRNFDTLTVMNAPRRFFWEGQAVYLAIGARFVNASGEDFMRRYSPTLGSDTDNCYICRAMALEMHKGNGPIYLDLSGVSMENMDLVEPNAGSQLLNYNKLRDEGIDFLHDKNVEFIPQVQLTSGGIAADINGWTGVDGLFCAGRCRSLDYMYMGGFGLSSSAVTGYIAGESAAELLSGGRDLIEPDKETLETYRGKIFAPLGKRGRPPANVLDSLNRLLAHYDVCLIQSEESLKAALMELDRIEREEITAMGAEDTHYLMKYYEVRGIAFLTRLFLLASLERRESRGSHFRLDYPERDDRFLGWITHVRDAGGGIHTGFERVPVEKYKNPIDKYYTDNFNFQIELGGE